MPSSLMVEMEEADVTVQNIYLMSDFQLIRFSIF